VELASQPGQPPLLDEYLREGWPLDADGQRVSLYTAWCWFFRETVKDRPKVFNIYVAETLAELKQQLSRAHPDLSPALARLPAPALDDFRASLAAGFAELKTYLDARFDDMGQRLDAIRVTQAAHTGLLHDLRDLIGGFPGLWQFNRRWRYGLIGFAALVLGGGVYLIYQTQQNPQQTAAAVVQSFDAKTVAARLRTEIEERFQRDKAQAIQAGQHWDALRELEKQRDTALAKVDDVITTIEQGLAGKPDLLFAEASRILQTEGTDAALGYLSSHKAERQARAARDKAGAEAAEEKLRQDAQALFLEAELRQTRYEWEPALAALREAAELAPHWWETRWRLGNLLIETAQYAEAQPHLQAAVALAEKDADRANAMHSLAVAYKDQENWIEAERFYRQALAIYQMNFALENPTVARLLNNLAHLLMDTNRLAKAEPLLKRALQIEEDTLGQEHPSVAKTLSSLGLLLQDTNRPSEAEPLMRRALAIDEKSYGPDHPDIAFSLTILARLMYITNRLDEAEPLMRRALAINEKTYGVEHPNVATNLNNLALLLQHTNRLAEAESLMRRALAIDEKSFGSEHSVIARDLINLAQLLQDTNRLAEAEPLMRRALAIDEKSLGPEHPNVAVALSNLATLMHATNRLTEAEPLMRRALAIDEKSFGPEHPSVATNLNNLAQLLQDTNRLAEAEPLERRAVLILMKFSRAAGQEDPKLLKFLGNYLALLTAQKLKPQAIAQRLDSLGPEAGYTAEAYGRLCGQVGIKPLGRPE